MWGIFSLGAGGLYNGTAAPHCCGCPPLDVLEPATGAGPPLPYTHLRYRHLCQHLLQRLLAHRGLLLTLLLNDEELGAQGWRDGGAACREEGGRWSTGVV